MLAMVGSCTHATVAIRSTTANVVTIYRASNLARWSETKIRLEQLAPGWSHAPAGVCLFLHLVYYYNMESPSGKESEASGIFTELQTVSTELTRISEYDNFYDYVSIGFSHIRAANESIKKYSNIKDEVRNTEEQFSKVVDWYFDSLTNFLIMLDIDYDIVDWSENSIRQVNLREELVTLCTESRETFLTFHPADTQAYQHFDIVLSKLEHKVIGDDYEV